MHTLSLMASSLLATPQDDAAPIVAGLMAMWGVMMLVGLGILAFMIFCWWRIFDKAGYAGALSLLMLIPGGALVLVLILAFGDWPALKR
jgi:hypothetical protein